MHFEFYQFQLNTNLQAMESNSDIFHSKIKERSQHEIK